MRKVYIDCGAHRGDTIKAFINSGDYEPGFEIHAFEPNPYAKVHKRYGGKFSVYKLALWIEEREMPFYIKKPKRGSQAGTLLKEKISGDLDKKHPITVMAIDFGRWIREHFVPDDFIIVKMDIEGAEYKVIPSMIADGSIRYINKLYLETHENRIGLTLDDLDALMSALRKIDGLIVGAQFSNYLKTELLVRGVPAGEITGESTRLRFYRKLDYLPKDFKWKPIKEEFKGSVLYIQKRVDKKELINNTRRIGIPVVYDSDDGEGVRRKGDDTQVFPLVNAVTTDSEERAEAFRKVTTTPVYVVPDGIDYIDKRPKPLNISERISRICTFGSDRSTGAAVYYLKAIQHDYHVAYITRTKIDALRKCKYVEWKLGNFIEKLSRYDLCIIVHEDTDERACKANTRLVTAMSIGLPAIVSRTPSYVTIMKACGAEDLIVDKPEEVHAKIGLLQDRTRRIELQKRFMDYAWEHYDPKDMAAKLAEVFRRVIDATNSNLQ